jgi:hypothetical protein
MAYSKKVANSRGTTVNQNQGGGSKKAGFPYMVGRSQWSNIYFPTSTLLRYNNPIYTKKVSPLAGLRFTKSMGVDHY